MDGEVQVVHGLSGLYPAAGVLSITAGWTMAAAWTPSPPPTLSPPTLPPPGRSKFESEMQVRPDDIDMNRHVHNARYFDYVLAARYDQMARCYGMPMEEFLAHGFGWVVRTAHVQYKRPLGLGDWMIVRTWIEEIVKRRRDRAIPDPAPADGEALRGRVLRLHDGQPRHGTRGDDPRLDPGEIRHLKAVVARIQHWQEGTFSS